MFQVGDFFSLWLVLMTYWQVYQSEEAHLSIDQQITSEYFNVVTDLKKLRIDGPWTALSYSAIKRLPSG